MRKFVLFLMLVLSLGAQAKEAPPAAADPALEKRMLDLTEQLRCLVCQNQTIADSHADLAIDLKNQVREKLAAGMSDKEVINYMVDRYGDFVLYKPPVKETTWLLWFGPFLLLVVGIGVLMAKLKRRNATPDNVPEEDLKRAASLLKDTNNSKDQA
ncbi:MAG TPA: cytochrome c-type biogenesis protein [Noviherbaspirillum sp.]|uniref:cytochrome c-type biogenesis protein n=1 Tax=Noviherbaspirillum sp. TaxID=1926288 RepID=UPI002B489202|nr:cytochrome c-type biogenesis protein [Noviherbaspirillum sp.]HJV88634.1 cytochrome c-type biogenesis protein [Noviherbaspirillum sp.]